MVVFQCLLGTKMMFELTSSVTLKGMRLDRGLSKAAFFGLLYFFT